MKNKFRVWDSFNNKMILPEEEENSYKDDSILSVGLHGLPIAVDGDSFRNKHRAVGWNVDHNRFLMRYSDLKDRQGDEVVDGDIRIYKGKMYKVVDDGWRFRFERNLVEFHENENIQVDEDTAWESALIGNIYTHPHLLLNYKANETIKD